MKSEMLLGTSSFQQQKQSAKADVWYNILASIVQQMLVL
jgi:hypothetical protein